MDNLNDRINRYERMKALKATGMTLEAIGAAEDPPLTKQRVRRILEAPPRANGRPPKEVRPTS